MSSYQTTANDARKTVLRLIHKAQTSHIASNFSVIDIMTVLFDYIDLDRDRLVVSAGWKAAALYYFLWLKGKITEEELNSYCTEGGKFIGLCEPIIPEIKAAGGSMSIGFSMAVGMARARKLLVKEGKVYVIMSDGEMQCGSTWESALKAGHEKLNNLVVLVDNNGFQAMGKTNEILNIEPLEDKWRDFGWDTYQMDGHNYGTIEDALKVANYRSDKPLIIIANTIKGKGVSFMENTNLFHYKSPNGEEYELALKELNG